MEFQSETPPFFMQLSFLAKSLLYISREHTETTLPFKICAMTLIYLAIAAFALGGGIIAITGQMSQQEEISQ